MKKFEGILFCTDLDGTLYTDGKKVSRENLDAIEYFKSEGGLFTFITGRVPCISRQVCSIIAPNAPFGCVNGGGIYDPVREKYLWTQNLPAEVLELVHFTAAQMPDMGIQINTEENIYFHRDSSAMDYFRRITGMPDTPWISEGFSEPIMKILFAQVDPARISALAELLAQHPSAGEYDFIQPEQILYEILPKGVSKGKLLEKLALLLHIDMARTVAVGDYFNDISMLRAAGRGYAVANAVEEAKAAADYVTVSNNEHAIAAIVEHLESSLQ